MDNTPNSQEKIEFIKSLIKPFPDFPKQGILFRDIFSALTNGKVCKYLKEVLLEYIKSNFPDVEALVGLDARGFLFSFTLAAELEIAFIPVRKKGKLPGNTISYKYTLEYDTNEFEIQQASFWKPGIKCLIIDDLIATGGSMNAAINLLNQCKADIIGCLCVIELLNCKGRENLLNIPLYSLIQY